MCSQAGSSVSGLRQETLPWGWGQAQPPYAPRDGRIGPPLTREPPGINTAANEQSQRS